MFKLSLISFRAWESLINFFNKYFNNDLAIDLGTANTLIFMKGRGIVLNEPSVIAVREDFGRTEIIAVGREAKMMLGKTPAGIKAICPLSGGVISDFEMAQAMLKYFIQKALGSAKLIKPKIIICIPYGVTPVEKRAVKESAEQAGAREAFLVEEPMAAAIGAELPISEPVGSMVVDIGGGTTEVAIISLGGIVYSKSLRIAGDSFDDAIASYVKKKHSLLIGQPMSEKIKISIGDAYPLNSKVKTFQVKGRDLINRGPKTVEVTSEEICDALSDSISEIVEVIKLCLEKTPPELSSDIFDNGIILTGGGAMLTNLDVHIREKIGLPVMLEADPLTCVVRGCGILLESIPLLKELAL